MSPWLLALSRGNRRRVHPVRVARAARAAWATHHGGTAARGAVTLVVALLLDAPAARAQTRCAVGGARRVAEHGARRHVALARGARLDSPHRRRVDLRLRRFGRGASIRRRAARSGVSPAARWWNARSARAIRSSSSPMASSTIPKPLARFRRVRASSCCRIAPRRDLAVASIDVPRAVVSGDTVEARVGVDRRERRSARRNTRAVARGQADRDDSRSIRSPPSASAQSRQDAARGRRQGRRCLRAIVASPDDAEPRNDTLAVAIDLSRAASAVFVSTSPDFDARYSLAVLRGALGDSDARISSRCAGRMASRRRAHAGAGARGAPGAARCAGRDHSWRHRRVRRAAQRSRSGRSRLIVTAPTEGEWYPSAAPPSPLAPALAGIVWDSLPPVGLATTAPNGDWQGMEARRGRGEERRPIVVGTDEPRRVVIVAASGLWRWRFRGGVASDAFTALWGSIFDWLAAERARSSRGGSRRARAPRGRIRSAGVAGRRPTRSSPVTLHQRGSGRVDSLTLRFARWREHCRDAAAAGRDLRVDDARRDRGARRESRRASGCRAPPRVAAADRARRRVRGRGAAAARRRLGVRARDIDACAPNGCCDDDGACGEFDGEGHAATT